MMVSLKQRSPAEHAQKSGGHLSPSTTTRSNRPRITRPFWRRHLLVGYELIAGPGNVNDLLAGKGRTVGTVRLWQPIGDDDVFRLLPDTATATRHFDRHPEPHERLLRYLVELHHPRPDASDDDTADAVFGALAVILELWPTLGRPPDLDTIEQQAAHGRELPRRSTRHGRHADTRLLQREAPRAMERVPRQE